MKYLNKRLVSVAVLLGGSALGVQASSTASSASSDSIGSSSDSVRKSSDSSSKGGDVAEGDYKVIEVAAVAERAGMVRMKLQAVAAPADAQEDGEFYLYLPQQAFDSSRLTTGQVVAARHRDYGVEFANADTRRAFFLVLHDAWYRELQSNPVVL